MPSLSVLIAARNEMFLNRTVADVLAHRRGDTDIVVVLDGDWPDEPLAPDPRVRVVKLSASIGQRASINLAARLSSADYIMKLDAHCGVAEGFDVELMRAAEELGPNVTQVPAQWNLHAFDWVCGCGWLADQGPKPSACGRCQSPNVRMDVVWTRRRLSEAWRFDSQLRFQPNWGEWKDKQGDAPIIDTMTCLGACWMQRRDRFWALGGLDEGHGSWGQVGVEVALKAWLSGGRLVTNRQTWYAHMFRTQQGFRHPYPITEEQVERARVYSRNLWRSGTWPLQIRSLRSLVEQFWPVPGWSEADLEALETKTPSSGTTEGRSASLFSDPARADAQTRSERDHLQIAQAISDRQGATASVA